MNEIKLLEKSCSNCKHEKEFPEGNICSGACINHYEIDYTEWEPSTAVIEEMFETINFLITKYKEDNTNPQTVLSKQIEDDYYKRIPCIDLECQCCYPKEPKENYRVRVLKAFSRLSKKKGK